MSNPVEAGARATAERLKDRYGSRLVAEVEELLAARDSQAPPDQYLDPTAVAGVIVSAATFAWTVFTNLRSKKEAATPEIVTRTVIVQIQGIHVAETVQDEQVIAMAVQETLKAIGGAAESLE